MSDFFAILVLAFIFRKEIIEFWQGLVRAWHVTQQTCYRTTALLLWPRFDDGRDWNKPLRNLLPVSSYGIQGGARYAECGEVARAGAFSALGLPLGQFIDSTRAVFLLGNGPWLRHASDGHIFLCAPTGSGKATDFLIPALLAPWDTGSWFVLDVKGGQLAVVTHPARNTGGRRAYYINLFRRHTDILGEPVGCNPMRGLDPASPDFGIQCDGIASDIIEPTGGDAHWTHGSHPLLAGVIAYFRKYMPVTLHNLIAVRTAIAAGFAAPQVFAKLIDDAMATRDPIIKERLARFANVGLDDREARGIISTVLAQTHFMISSEAIIESLKGNFSFATLRSEPGASVFVVVPAEYLKDLRKWMRLLCGSALRELMAKPQGQPVNFLVDEMPELGAMASLQSVVRVGRALGIRGIFAAQDLSQLKRVYGEEWHSFLANTGIHVFQAPRDPFTLDYLSKECGFKTIEGVTVSEGASNGVSGGSGYSINYDPKDKHLTRLLKSLVERTVYKGKGVGIGGLSTSINEGWSSGTNNSTSTSQQRREFLLPQELKLLQKNQQLIFSAGVPHPILAVRRPYWEIKALAGSYFPDPHYTGPLPPTYRPAQPAVCNLRITSRNV